MSASLMLREPLDEAVDERLLAAEVVEQSALGDAGRRGDGVEGRGAFALLDEEFGEGVEDAVAGCGLLRHGSIVFGASDSD